MHKASIKKRLLPLLALLLAAGAVFLLLPQEKFDGERIARPDTYRLDIRQMTGTDRHTMALQAGDVLQIRFACSSGALYLSITAPDGTNIYSGDGRQVTQFSLTVPSTGDYMFCVTARHGQGHLQIQKEENGL